LGILARKDSVDTIMENVDGSAHQDEEVIVFNGSDISRRSNFLHTQETRKPSNLDGMHLVSQIPFHVRVTGIINFVNQWNILTQLEIP
jgi:hypothetical protein